MKFIRTFIAIELNQQIQDTLKDTQNDLQKLDVDARWVKPSNIHLTLKFLGNISPKKLKAIQEIFPEMFKNFSPFDISLAHLGVFPKINRPRIIWAGIEDKDNKVQTLAETAENHLCRLGFPKERKEFSPHVTIARLRSLKNQALPSQRIKEYSFPEGLTQTVRHVILFKSTLTPQGSIYEPLSTAELKNSKKKKVTDTFYF